MAFFFYWPALRQFSSMSAIVDHCQSIMYDVPCCLLGLCVSAVTDLRVSAVTDLCVSSLTNLCVSAMTDPCVSAVTDPRVSAMTDLASLL